MSDYDYDDYRGPDELGSAEWRDVYRVIYGSIASDSSNPELYSSNEDYIKGSLHDKKFSKTV